MQEVGALNSVAFRWLKSLPSAQARVCESFRSFNSSSLRSRSSSVFGKGKSYEMI